MGRPREDSMSLTTQWEDRRWKNRQDIGQAVRFDYVLIGAHFCISDLASNEAAWRETRRAAGFVATAFPADDMSWGTVSTRDATTWVHIDDLGMGTGIKMVTGCKLWVIAVPKRKTSRNVPTGAGDMSSIHAFSGWSTTEAGDEVWDHEAVLLGPGDTL